MFSALMHVFTTAKFITYALICFAPAYPSWYGRAQSLSLYSQVYGYSSQLGYFGCTLTKGRSVPAVVCYCIHINIGYRRMEVHRFSYRKWWHNDPSSMPLLLLLSLLLCATRQRRKYLRIHNHNIHVPTCDTHIHTRTHSLTRDTKQN